MKHILPPTMHAEMFCGSSKRQSDTLYKKTQNCIEVECIDGTLLYNTLTGALLLIGKDEDRSKAEEELIIYRFLVPWETNECSFAEDYRAFIKLFAPKEKAKTSFTILTTTDCNARCFYCYELGRKRIPMSIDTAKDVAAYITEASGGENVKLHWFGGEPLYNMEAIDTIISGLKDYGVSYSSKITTNGFYLDKSIAKKARADWNTKQIQITLDGMEGIYNNTKAYIDKTVISPYQKVMDNIGYALDEGINVHIRLNMDRNNAEDLFDLCDELFLRFGTKGVLKANISLLKEFTGSISGFSSEEEAAERYFSLYDKLEKLGLCQAGKLERRIHFNKCMADSDHCEVILPDGNVGRCEHFSETEITGNIYNSSRDEEIIKSWKEPADQLDSCSTCALYPSCLRLKKCDWDKDGCSLSDRIIKTELLKKKILHTYQSWKQENQ